MATIIPRDEVRRLLDDDGAQLVDVLPADGGRAVVVEPLFDPAVDGFGSGPDDVELVELAEVLGASARFAGSSARNIQSTCSPRDFRGVARGVDSLRDRVELVPHNAA